LEQEDGTEREGNCTHSEDAGIHDAVADGELTNVATSNLMPCPHVEENDSRGSKNVADERNGRLALQNTPIAGRGGRSLGSLPDAADFGWRDAVVQGIGHSNGAVQLRPGVGKDDEHSAEVDLFLKFNLDVFFVFWKK